MNDIKITVTDRAGRKCASSGSKWEPIMGYSRAVRSGNFIAVTGTVGVNADGTYSKTIGEQTRRSLAIVRAAIEALGGRIDQVIDIDLPWPRNLEVKKSPAFASYLGTIQEIFHGYGVF